MTTEEQLMYHPLHDVSLEIDTLVLDWLSQAEEKGKIPLNDTSYFTISILSDEIIGSVEIQVTNTYQPEIISTVEESQPEYYDNDFVIGKINNLSFYTPSGDVMDAKNTYIKLLMKEL